MISAFKAAEISNENCKELEKIEHMILEAANLGERCIRYEKKVDNNTLSALEDLGYEVAFKQMNGGFANETYIRW